MNFNLVRCVVIFNTLIIGLGGLALYYAEMHLPTSIIRLYHYGKFNRKFATRHFLIEKFEFTKQSYVHFYLISGPVTVILFYLGLKKYLYNIDIPENLLSVLDFSLGTSRKPLISGENTLLAIAMISIHWWKRAYEQMYVCVFSGQKINILHYIIGYLHFWSTITSIVGESKGFVRGSHAELSLDKLTTTHLLCVLIFLWSTYVQFESNRIFAGLRKNQHGDVVTKEHKIPTGALFNYISGPLQFTEILVYLMVSVVLWQASTYHYVTLFVIVNQVEAAYLNHQWYRNTFKNYPKERKIIIPYIF